MKRQQGNGSSNPIVKSGKRGPGTGVTDATVKRLERVGSSESAKIARDYLRSK
jgi:hypothetical protein